MLKKNWDHYRNFLPHQMTFEVSKGPLKGSNYFLSPPYRVAYQTKAYELTITTKGLKIIFDHIAEFLDPKRLIFATLGYIRSLVGLTTKILSQEFFLLMSCDIFWGKNFDETLVSLNKVRKFRNFALFACAIWCGISNETLWIDSYKWGVKNPFWSYCCIFRPKETHFRHLGLYRITGWSDKKVFVTTILLFDELRHILRKKFDEILVSLSKDRKYRKFALFACAIRCGISNET